MRVLKFVVLLRASVTSSDLPKKLNQEKKSMRFSHNNVRISKELISQMIVRVLKRTAVSLRMSKYLAFCEVTCVLLAVPHFFVNAACKRSASHATIGHAFREYKYSAKLLVLR